MDSKTYLNYFYGSLIHEPFVLLSRKYHILNLKITYKFQEIMRIAMKVKVYAFRVRNNMPTEKKSATFKG